MGLLKRFVVIGIIVLLPGFVFAGKEPKIKIEPAKIVPGDIAIITINNVAGPVKGTFNKRSLFFNELASKKGAVAAILAVDLYLEPGKYDLEIQTADRQLRRKLTVKKKDYPVQRLTLPKGMVELSPENEARAERDQKKNAALWPVFSPRMWSGNFINPVPGKEIGGKFGVRRVINNIPKSSHSGVDVIADEGTPVLAPNNGVVVLVDDQFFAGNSVVLDHGDGIYTMFFHLSKPNVRYGQAVMKGDVIGFVGATGRASGAHLHWGVRVQESRVDPLRLINLKLE